MNRIAKWDNAKFVLIILVVICHFYENYLGSSKLVNSFVLFRLYVSHAGFFSDFRYVFQENREGKKNCKSSTISAGLFVYENVWLFCIRYYEWRNIYIG